MEKVLVIAVALLTSVNAVPTYAGHGGAIFGGLAAAALVGTAIGVHERNKHDCERYGRHCHGRHGDNDDGETSEDDARGEYRGFQD